MGGNPQRWPEALRRFDRLLQRSHQIWRHRRERLPEVTYPPELPITARREEIVRLIRENQVVVIAGETGSGKTTQIPKMCLEAGLGVAGRIACTQPRRVAALSVSRRIAEELKVAWGEEVGCKIRFADQTAPHTLVKMMTDGLLLAESQGDPDLTDYEAVIIDEAHERSLNIDFLLGHLQLLRHKRPELKIIITSATIDPEAFSRAFGGAPVVEVSGRTFPVEVVYRPLDTFLEEEGELTSIEAAAAAAEEIVQQRRPGDILIFMPGERDIRETRDLIEGRRLPHCEVLPLFGRLSGGDQQRIFERSQRRKIIIATNIAETSLTIPGIRFVIDTGTARISRFSPHTRTQRLPVEPISRSSADQRKGRCGRVAEGICFRLYSEEDYESRPRFTPPEILRANLAAVILRMKAFELGDVETFPFIDPPQERAIKAGYVLLQDLGALDQAKDLTELGRQLARFPVDPTVGRMLLQARREHALREVLVIAAGLSVQDPRERPMEKREAADQMHRRFVHPESDFLTLLNIWNAYHDETERLSQGQLRKFCKTHFLSYTRMREWRDIHQQLVSVLKDLDQFRLSDLEPESVGIHRSILTGLLANVARHDSGNSYRATHSRLAMIFPGSGLFNKKAGGGDRKTRLPQTEKPDKIRMPEWIMAAEWMETNRLYARTVARVEASWILELGKHLCKSSVKEPQWDPKAGRVLARERVLLYGLEIARRRVGYDRYNPAEACEIFIREGLAADTVEEQLPFLQHNREVRQNVEQMQTRLRRSVAFALEERMVVFYRERLENVSSVAALRKLIAERGGDQFLRVSEADLIPNVSEAETKAFPAEVKVGDQVMPLEYTYSPGAENDGVTLKVPVGQFDAIQPGMLDWLVPGYLEEKIDCLLRGLPKETRKQLFPIGDRVQELLHHLTPSPRPLTEVLAEEISLRYGVRIRPDEWPEENVPQHLKPRIEVKDTEDRTLAAGRNWEKVAESFRRKVEARTRQGIGASSLQGWQQAAARWERHGLTSWSFGDLPEAIQVGDLAGIPIEAVPGLQKETDGSVSLRLFRSRTEAEAASREGLLALVEHDLGKDLAWMRKDLKVLRKLAPFYVTLSPTVDLEEGGYRLLLEHLLLREPVLPLKEARYRQLLERAKGEMRGLPVRLSDLLGNVLQKRQEILTGKLASDWLKEEVEKLLPRDFLAGLPYSRLQHIPRYLQAMLVRADRARVNPHKDAERAAQVQPFSEAVKRLEGEADKKGYSRAALEELRWMVEEFKVSTFAQELGTSTKVSARKLEDKIREIQA
jgi:ATP-dependent helicase HrpA